MTAAFLDSVWMITTPDADGKLDRGVVYSAPARSAAEAWENGTRFWNTGASHSADALRQTRKDLYKRGFRARRVNILLGHYS